MRVFLRVQGIVQGVGFRPFVARLAEGLVGWVENTSRGVEIEVQGSAEEVDAFRTALEASPPPMAAIMGVETSEIPEVGGESGFVIRSSRTDPVASAIIPPDIATCPACLQELRDPGDRRHGYAFINCTDCGPRYTIIGGIPYDRDRTTMARFAMCHRCAAEYGDPRSRRFHAQPNACPSCGPRLSAVGPDGAPIPGNPLEEAVRHLREGGIVALLGLGGFHLACDGTNDQAVAELRRRKDRPGKPLALMVPDLGSAGRFVVLDAESRALLESPRAPIVLLRAQDPNPAAPSVAPGQGRLGVFLPTTPLHHLLFGAGGFQALVMTSGNRSDEPILATWEEARGKLAGVAGLFLLHDRPILHRIDDSVVKAMESPGPVILRRARGYAPAPLPLSNPRGRVVLGMGAELANTYCAVRGAYAYLGPHVGDLKNLDVESAFRSGIDHLLSLLQVEPDLVVCDLHPQYRSTRYAEAWERRGIPLLRVQHHEAHAASCMAEHGFEGAGLVLALDGFGYGHDGTLWGGELLAGRPGRLERVGHLAPVPQPGGDRAAREPWRMAASHLRRLLGPGWTGLELPAFRQRKLEELEVLERMLHRGLNTPVTTSCGRLFDAAAAILGFTGSLLYSAHAAMELEALAARADDASPLTWDGAVSTAEEGLVMDPGGVVEALLSHALGGRDPSSAALAFHRGLARLLAVGAAAGAELTGLGDVFLTGGCLQNAVLARHLDGELRRVGLRPRFHRRLPPNDGCIAFGQVAWALARDLGGPDSEFRTPDPGNG